MSGVFLVSIHKTHRMKVIDERAEEMHKKSENIKTHPQVGIMNASIK